MKRIARHVLVTGRVQGVAFRWSTQREAERLAVDGWVRNRTDGRVEAWVEGEAGAVEELLRWMGDGPPSARVTGLEEREVVPESVTGFDVRATARGAG